MPYLLLRGGNLIELSKEDARDLKGSSVRSFRTKGTDYEFTLGRDVIYVDPDYDGG